MAFDWPYFILLPDGTLVYEDTRVPICIDRRDGSTPWFKDAAEAETWLVENDIRGSVR